MIYTEFKEWLEKAQPDTKHLSSKLLIIKLKKQK